MLAELDQAQESINNRCDAVMKIGAFLGTGLAVLAKFDAASPIPGIGVGVVVVSGLSLGAALFAQNSPVRLAVILLPATFEDLERSCSELAQNQIVLILASLLLFLAIAASVVAVTFSVLR
jgi:hypothetical protein